MRSFNLFYRNDEKSFEIADKIKERLIEASFEFDQLNPDLVISIGGDGTMLKAIHHYIDKLDDIFFCGVHTGTLGFYTDFLDTEVDDLICKIIDNDYYQIKFNMLKVELECENNINILYALNEARLENNKHTQVMDVFINNKYFETFRGNGLNFATPTGSTGYNKSLGGAIVHPRTKAMQMTEIAAINNITYRALGSSLILDQSHCVTIKLRGIEGAVLGYDSYAIDLSEEYPTVDSITFELCDKSVKFARFKARAFMDRVKKNFIFDDI